MARVIYTNSYDRSLIGNAFLADESVRRRKERDTRDFMESVGRHRGQEYMERFNDRSRALDMDRLARLSLSINRHNNSSFRDDMYMELIDIGDTQNAPEIMLDYLLTDRKINYLGRNQRLEAWGRDIASYDAWDKIYNRDNPYYRALNHSMVRPSDLDDNDMVVENFLFNEDEDTPSLTHDERRAIYLSRDMILDIFEEGHEDPTSRSNNLL